MVCSLDLLISKEFGNMNILVQTFYLFIVLNNFKYKAYSCWFFADGVNILSGLSYGGKDKEGNHVFDRNIAVNFMEVETGTNPRDLINNWNIQVAQWLK